MLRSIAVLLCTFTLYNVITSKSIDIKSQAPNLSCNRLYNASILIPRYTFINDCEKLPLENIKEPLKSTNVQQYLCIAFNDCFNRMCNAFANTTVNPFITNAAKNSLFDTNITETCKAFGNITPFAKTYETELKTLRDLKSDKCIKICGTLEEPGVLPICARIAFINEIVSEHAKSPISSPKINSNSQQEHSLTFNSKVPASESGLPNPLPKNVQNPPQKTPLVIPQTKPISTSNQQQAQKPSEYQPGLDGFSSEAGQFDQPVKNSPSATQQKITESIVNVAPNKEQPQLANPNLVPVPKKTEQSLPVSDLDQKTSSVGVSTPAVQNFPPAQKTPQKTVPISPGLAPDVKDSNPDDFGNEEQEDDDNDGMELGPEIGKKPDYDDISSNIPAKEIHEKPADTSDNDMQNPQTYQTQSVEEEDSYFFTYFMFFTVVFVIGYVGYHNKQKLLALILEGRRGRSSSSRRRPNTASYRKLDSNLEEAVTSSCSNNSTHVIY